jgi:hypothetical protein
MTKTFANKSDVIIYNLERKVSFAREKQYLFVANCAWWIAGVIGLDSGLTIHMNILATRRHLEQREISTVPQDIARSVYEDSDQRKIEEELLPVSCHSKQQAKRNTRTLRSNTGNRVNKLFRRQRKKLAKGKK